MAKQPSSDTALYERVALELEAGDKQTGLWTKAFALADGDEQKTKARYISLRVAQLAELDHPEENVSAPIPDSLNAVPEQSDQPLKGKSEQSGDQQTQPRGFLLAIVDALPAFSSSLYLIGVALAVVIPSFFDKGRLSNAEVIAAFVIGTLLATTVMVMALWPKKNVGSVTFVWKRLGAKYLDFCLVVLLIAGGLRFFAPLSREAVMLIFVSGTWIGWILLETLGLNRYGTTPGRALLGIKVRRTDESANFLLRSLSLAFWGLGLSIPIVTGITQAIAYKRFRETGETRWDAAKFEVSSTSIGIGRLIVFALVLMFFLVLGSVLGKSIERMLVHINQPSVASLPTEAGNGQSSGSRIASNDLLTREQDLNSKLGEWHPDWKSVIQSKQFIYWTKFLSCEDQKRLSQGLDADYISTQLNRFKRGDSNGSWMDLDCEVRIGSQELKSSDLPGAGAQDVDTPRVAVDPRKKGAQGGMFDGFKVISVPDKKTEIKLSPEALAQVPSASVGGPAASQLKQPSEGQKPQTGKDESPRIL